MTLELYELVDFFPSNVREFFKRQLDFASDEIQNHNRQHDVILREDEKQIVLITVFMNLIENGFVKSYKSYQNALSYINKFDIQGFSVGSKVFEKSNVFTKDWERFVYEFNKLKRELQEQKLLIPYKSIPDLIQLLIRQRHE